MRRLVILAATIVAVLVYSRFEQSPDGFEQSPNDDGRSFVTPADGTIVETSGLVQRLLSDDNEGSRHQRFILRVGADRTLLVSHNIDVAPRISDLEVGDNVEVKGEYEWNRQGGVLHWTHHDPAGRHESGWIRHGGREYR
jgi:hypothetical protein